MFLSVIHYRDTEFTEIGIEGSRLLRQTPPRAKAMKLDELVRSVLILVGHD
jgi:hypothetical protein